MENINMYEKIKIKDIFSSLIAFFKENSSNNEEELDIKIQAVCKEQDTNNITALESDIQNYGGTSTKTRKSSKISIEQKLRREINTENEINISEKNQNENTLEL